MARLLDRCGFIATAGGTADYVVASAVLGSRDPAAAGAVDGALYSYYAQTSDLTQYEWGAGLWQAATSTLRRTKIFGSTNAGAAVNFTQAPIVRIDALAENIATSIPACGRLIYQHTFEIEFTPVNGCLIQIAGVLYSMPGGSIVAAINNNCFIEGVGSSTLAASTFYYVYMFNNAGNLALDFSATGYTIDSSEGNVGVSIKSGDSSRTLVGWVRTDGSGNFSLANVGTWFNRSQPSPVNITGLSNNAITGTTSFKMYGYGGSVSLTPMRSGTFLIFCSFRAQGTSVSQSNGDDYAIYYGTGTAPSLGAAVTGTQACIIGCSTPSGAINFYPIFGSVSGLTIGTPYWFDVAGLVGASTATMQLFGPAFLFMEL